jgi:hypothetical protein
MRTKTMMLIVLLAAKALQGTFVIDTPGQYTLGGDLFEDPGVDIILITTNGVLLDLEEHVLSSGLAGIRIDPNLSQIEIRNGQIIGVDIGISIGSGCSQIAISEMTLINCLLRGIEVLGTTAALDSQILFDDINLSNCSFGATGDFPIFISFGCNILMNKMRLLANGNASNSVSLVRTENSREIIMNDFVGLDNTGSATFIGFDFVNPKNCAFEGVVLANSSAVGSAGDFFGFRFTSTAEKNVLSECIILSCTGAGIVTGYELNTDSQNNIFENCVAANLLGGSIIGFAVRGSGTPSNTVDNIFNLCDSVNGEAVNASGLAIGFLISRADFGTLARSAMSYNFASTGTGTGISFESGTGGNRWTIAENNMVRNIGVSNANSFGIRVETGTDNLFIRNFAFNNGETAGNQFSGVPLGSQVQLNPSNLNTSTEPWTNVAVTP